MNPSDPTAPARIVDLGTIIKIAPLQQRESLEPLRRQQGYTRPQINQKEIKYPLQERWLFANSQSKPPGMAEQLIDLRNKPLGETIVIPNVPKSHFYVAVLTKKEVPNIEDFNKNVFQTMNQRTSKSAQPNDPFYSNVAFLEAVGAFAKDLLERLKAETSWVETEELKKQSAKKEEFPE